MQVQHPHAFSPHGGQILETTTLTQHSVALRPEAEGHAAITISFTDVTSSAMALELVKRSIEW